MNAASQVIFDEAEHSYTVDGVRWPSVTQILQPLMELDGIPKAALEAAAQFGSHVHMACHLWNLGRLDESDLDEPLRPYLDGWKRFLRDTGAVVLESERIVRHPVLRVAGMLDDVIRFPRKSERHILDLKTGSDVHWTVALQTAAYREMLWIESLNAGEDRPPLSRIRFCCHLLPDASYRLYTLKEYTRDLNDFISCANFHSLRTQHVRKLS